MPLTNDSDQIQEICLDVAADIEKLALRLRQARSVLRIPFDSSEIYEESLPWPLELELDAALGGALDDYLHPAAELLRAASRADQELLRRYWRTRE